MARNIDPMFFGQQGLLMAFMGLFFSFVNLGDEYYTIKATQDDLPRVVGSQITIRLFILALIAVLMTALYPARFYFGLQNIYGYFLWLFLAQAVSDVGNIYRAVMNKELQLDKLSLIDMTSTLTATLTACFLARSGVTLWALLALVITEQLIRTTLIAVVARIYPPMVDKQTIIDILNYGRYFLNMSIFSRLSGKISDISIGALAGNVALGFFQRAGMVLGFLHQIIATTVTDVAVPLFGKLLDASSRLSHSFEIISSLLVRVAFCAYVALAISMDEFISILYGSKWLPCVEIARLLLPYMLIQGLNIFVQNAQMVIGEPSYVSRVRMIEFAILAVLLFPMLKIWHVNGAAIALDISSLFAAGFFWIKIGSDLKISIKRIFAGPIVASMGGAVVSMALMMHLTTGNAILSFIVKNIFFIVVYVTVLLIIEYAYIRGIISTTIRKIRE